MNQFLLKYWKGIHPFLISQTIDYFQNKFQIRIIKMKSCHQRKFKLFDYQNGKSIFFLVWENYKEIQMKIKFFRNTKRNCENKLKFCAINADIDFQQLFSVLLEGSLVDWPVFSFLSFLFIFIVSSCCVRP